MATPKGQAVEFFKQRAEELTAGWVRVEVCPNGTLYKDKDVKKALSPVHKQMEDRLGKQFIRDIYEATAFDPDKPWGGTIS